MGVRPPLPDRDPTLPAATVRPAWVRHVVIGNLIFGVGAVAAIVLYFTPYLFGGFWDQMSRVPVFLRIPTGAVLVFTALMTLAIGLRYAFLMIVAYWSQEERVRLASRLETTRWPSVSIMVPAFNESETIHGTIEALNQLEYPDFEVLVVDDGSTDDTLELAQRHSWPGGEGRPRVRVFTKPNAGKWSALNLAYQQAEGELCLCVDADSKLHPQAVWRLARWFDDPHISACSGQIRVRNRINLLTRLQALEYVVGNGIVRAAQSFFRHVLIIPGPIAMFRRSALAAVTDEAAKHQLEKHPHHIDGPFEHDTLAEDCDATLAILQQGGHVHYDPTAISFTRAPHETFPLLNQRYRWTRGVLQASIKRFNRWRVTPGRQTEYLAWIGTLIVEILAWPLAELAGIASIILILLAVGVSGPFLFVLILLTLVDLNSAIFCLIVERDDLTLAPLVVVQRFYYGPVIALGKLFACFDQIIGRRAGW